MDNKVIKSTIKIICFLLIIGCNSKNYNKGNIKNVLERYINQELKEFKIKIPFY